MRRGPVTPFHGIYDDPGQHDGIALFEVWLIDTGKFVVIADLLPEFRNDRRWMRVMRLRRSLRMFLPRTEIERLPGLETVFSVANRGFEIRDTITRWYAGSGTALMRQWQELSLIHI